MSNNSNCCCSKHELLRHLDSTGEDDELFEKVLSDCVKKKDEFALYLNACSAPSSDNEVTSTASFISRLEVLANDNNPWAIAELGLHFVFVNHSREEYNKGKRYLLLGALLGEPRAQFYYAKQLQREIGNSALAKRLMVASASQGYHRAKRAIEEN